VIPVEQRLTHQNFWCFPAYDTIEHAWERAKNLVESGRRMIYVERWMDGGGLTVSPGLRVAEGGFQPGADFRKTADYAQFHIWLEPGCYAIGAYGYVDRLPEPVVAQRFHAKRDGIRIQVQGFGKGRDDHIEITSWNDYGVGRQTALYFEFEGVDQRAEREAAFLEMLAAHGDWTAEKLTKLAAEARYEWEPVAELVKRTTGEVLP
jgi:hypothetical protein